ncbi:protein kinase domain-containing protein [Streptomyces millisiae]|uniref:protein kinase domain-containing protein n=1 Tax=Streptomyces millisiae TaxID=3075542 RepID=UPI00374E02EE
MTAPAWRDLTADDPSRIGPYELLGRLGAGLAEALASSHGAGIVHRDLKPATVLLSAAGPRVIDFGICTAWHSATSASIGRSPPRRTAPSSATRPSPPTALPPGPTVPTRNSCATPSPPSAQPPTS